MSQQTTTTTAVIIAYLAGLLSGRGVFGFDQATWITLLTGAFGFALVVYNAIMTRKTAVVAAVNAMPEVKGVITQNTIDGRALAEAVPALSVATAGTVDAAAVAKA